MSVAPLCMHTGHVQRSVALIITSCDVSTFLQEVSVGKTTSSSDVIDHCMCPFV